MSADDGSPGYDTEYDPTADPHASEIGVGSERLAYRQLPRRLREARNVAELVETVRRYGVPPAAVALLLYGVARGVFEFLSEPFAISRGYVFTGWPGALAINLIYGLALAGFTCFLYFGVIGALAGFLSDEKAFDVDIFKAGAHLLLLFVPLLAVSGVIATTIPPSVAAVAGDGAPAVAEVHRAVAGTVQMRAVGVILAAGWIAVGFLLLPIVRELYDIDRKASVLAVLPVTLIAVVATVLI